MSRLQHPIEAPPTQVEHPWRAIARTAFQAIVMLAFIAPAIYGAATDRDPVAATGWAGTGLAFAAALTRVMALPGVEEFLRRFVPFLAASPTPSGRGAARHVDPGGE